MNKEKHYLDSGLLEDFCLGLMTENESIKILAAAAKSPAVKQRIEAIEKGLAIACRMLPCENTKQKILALLDTIDVEEVDLLQPPFINKYSDILSWNKAVQSLQPIGDFGEIKVHPLLQTSNAEMYVAWVETSIEEEGHDEHHFTESFFILEGTCECNLGGHIIYLQAGDFLEIPYKIHHSIKSTSPGAGYVKAVLQRRKIA